MKDSRGVDYIPGIAYIELATGEAFQVLNSEGTDWDQAATIAARDAWIAQHEHSAQ